MKDKLNTLVSSTVGRRLMSQLERTIEEEAMLPCLESGALVALSGGADSVLLLLLLLELQKKHSAVSLGCAHVHHGIRAEEADRDVVFCQRLCEALGIPLTVVYRDVPSYANEHGMGIEEAARYVRYEALRTVARESGCAYIVTAHHATDQVETVLFHMLRGSGLQGMCGMLPVSEDILRPMLSMRRADIVEALELAKIAFVEDSTNDSGEYMRNYIRHEILPRLQHVTQDPERAVTRMTRNLRGDAAYLNRAAENAFSALTDCAFACDVLRRFDKAIFVRVIMLWCAQYTLVRPEAVHLDALYRHIQNEGAFSLSLPGRLTFRSDGVHAVLQADCDDLADTACDPIEHALHPGMNHFPEYGFSLYVSKEKLQDFSSIVYKKSIQADLSSAIINGTLRFRFKRDGDAYPYGGMTRKLKKLFLDRHMSPMRRRMLPVLCDDSGIVWVPGFGVRDAHGTKTQTHGPFVTFFAQDGFPDE